jgi:glycosyltransferase involved in cell wall biosynthesis
MNTLAIIITAYQAQQYILDTFASLEHQIVPEGWQIRYCIGVDGCDNTANLLTKNKIGFYSALENVGTYILTNSLLDRAYKDGCEAFVRFDSDDVACENFLYYGIENSNAYGFSKTYCLKSAENLLPIKGKTFIESHGSTFFNRKSLEMLGGYNHYRIACDTDFIKRAGAIGLLKETYEKEPRYLYRRVKSSLSNASGTGKKSKMRNDICEDLAKSFKEGVLCVDPVTVKLTYVSEQ